MSVKIILINLHLIRCESPKNQVFIRQTTASKLSAALIIAPVQCFYSSSSSTRLCCLLILSDSVAKKLPESRTMEVAFRQRKARSFATYLRKIILSTQGCRKRKWCRWKKGSGASKLAIVGLHGRNVESVTVYRGWQGSLFSFHPVQASASIKVH